MGLRKGTKSNFERDVPCLITLMIVIPTRGTVRHGARSRRRADRADAPKLKYLVLTIVLSVLVTKQRDQGRGPDPCTSASVVLDCTNERRLDYQSRSARSQQDKNYFCASSCLRLENTVSVDHLPSSFAAETIALIVPALPNRWIRRS